jgi:hypothetical protein
VAEKNRHNRAIASLSLRSPLIGPVCVAIVLGRLPASPGRLSTGPGRLSTGPGRLRARSGLRAMRWRGSLAVLIVVLVGIAAVSGPAAAQTAPTVNPVAAVPQGFVGVDVDGPLFDPSAQLNLGDQLTQMVARGIQSVRAAFDWAATQPYASFNDPAFNMLPADQQREFVSIGGVPTDFTNLDQLVGLASQRGLTILPTVIYAPDWDAESNHSGGLQIPSSPAPYARFLSALVQRYGPNGSFWAANPSIRRVPIRRWQIWNEPDLAYYWPQPFASSYVTVLRAGHAAIKQADPGAQVVLGALTNFAWRSIGQIYRIPGARKLFDIVTVNGFTKTPAHVMLYLRLMRDALIHLGDAKKPLIATELSWPSAQGKSPEHWDFNTTESGQARNIAAVLPMLGAQRASLGLLGFYYFTWVGDEAPRAPAFDYAGLLALRNGRVVAKPALSAFTNGVLALEQCRRVSNLATRCAEPAKPSNALPADLPSPGRSLGPPQTLRERIGASGGAAGQAVDAVPLLAVGRIALGGIPGVEDARGQPAVKMAERGDGR